MDQLRLPRVTSCLCLMLLGVSAVLSASDSMPKPLVLKGGTVFDPISGKLQPDRTIVVDGSKIQSVGGPETKLPSDARVIDCRKKFIIPGLIDAHVHLVHLAD